MATSVHIPPPLLAAIDRLAKTRKISRNRLIVRALERELEPSGDWSSGCFERLATDGPTVVAEAEEMLRVILANRRSKKPVEL